MSEQEVAQRPEAYRRFDRPVPEWFSDAKLGIPVHWGVHAIPAWAEPIGKLGTIDFATWYRRNQQRDGWRVSLPRDADSPVLRSFRAAS